MNSPNDFSDPSGSFQITLFLCGDVMTGRGIDQILPFPGEPTLHEPFMKDARGYVTLAEQAGAAIPRGVDDRYIGEETGASRFLQSNRSSPTR